MTTLLGSNLSQFFTALSLFSTFLMLTKKSFLLEKVSHIKATTTFSIDGFTLREVKNGKFHEQKVCAGAVFSPFRSEFCKEWQKKENKNVVLVFFQQQKMKKVITADVERVVEFLGRFRDGFVFLFGENDRWRGDGVEK